MLGLSSNVSLQHKSLSELMQVAYRLQSELQKCRIEVVIGHIQLKVWEH